MLPHINFTAFSLLGGFCRTPSSGICALEVHVLPYSKFSGTVYSSPSRLNGAVDISCKLILSHQFVRALSLSPSLPCCATQSCIRVAFDENVRDPTISAPVTWLTPML